MRIIITGANGFTGQHLCKSLSAAGWEVHALGRGACRFSLSANLFYHDVELTDVRKLRECIALIMPSAIVHTAAMSKPDECHVNREVCLLNNVEVTRYLMEACAAHRAHMIHFSTDFIFGEDGPHAEDDTPNPLNFYGESKLMAEQVVVGAGIPYTIIRPVFIYGPVLAGMRPGFIQWVHAQLEQGRAIKVVTDQLRTPTYVGDICTGVATVLESRNLGVYHMAGPEILSPYDMACRVAQLCSLNQELIQPVTANEFPEPVRRAKRSGLQIEKARRALNYAPHSFAEALRHCFG